jgi:NTP pyrophosphatase (non-canonical NTP hydrolase)
MSDKFLEAWGEVSRAIHATAVEKGWWDEPRSPAECIALMHSELSEALEEFRSGDRSSEKIVGTAAEEELADVVIRIMDFADHNGLDVASAIIDKAEYNKSRPYKHGKKF